MFWRKRLPAQWRYRTFTSWTVIRRIAVWRPGGYGDTIMTIPLMRELAQIAPVTFYGHHAAGQIMVDQGLAESHKPAGYGTDGPWLLVDQAGHVRGESLVRLRQEMDGFDLVVVFSRNPDLAHKALEEIDTLNYAVGCVLPPPYLHQTRYMNRALPALGRPAVKDEIPRLIVPPQKKKNQVLIHAGTSNEGSNKRWPADRFLQAAEALYEHGYYPLLLCGPDDPEIPGWNKNWIVRGSIPEVQREMASSMLFIGNDSGMTHMAAAVDTPVLALYGPTHPNTWAPLSPKVRVVRECWKKATSTVSNFEAEVCSSPSCMTAITPEQVVWCAKSFLKDIHDRNL